MSKFVSKRRIVFQLEAGYETIVNGRVVATPARMFELKPGITDTSEESWLKKFKVKEEEVNTRIREDEQFGTESGVTEFTEEDQEAVKIKTRKLKEADEEIKEKRRRKK